MVGTDGTLRLTGGAPRGFQSGRLRLCRNGENVPIDEMAAGLEAGTVNVAGVYAALRDDIRDGGHRAPAFADAVRLGRLVDDIAVAAAEGRTVPVIALSAAASR